MRGKRRRLIGAAILMAAVLASAGWLGWLTPLQHWQGATGWEEIPRAARPRETVLWRGDSPVPRLHWLGHSGFLVEWLGQRILVDPNLSRHCTLSRRLMAPPLAAGELGPLDAVLISHAHYDHLDLPTLAAVPRLGRMLVPAGAAAYLEGVFDPAIRIDSLEPGSSLRLGELEVIAVEAAHNGNRYHPLASRQLALGYIIRSPEDAIYFAGDSGFGEHFAVIAERYQPRVAVLPIGAYAPRFPLAKFHLNPEEAVRVAKILGVEQVVPCHFGTFTLSLDRPSSALPRFARAAEIAGLRWMMPQLAAGSVGGGPPR